MTIADQRTTHPYEVEYDSNGTVAYQTVAAYEMITGDGLTKFFDPTGGLVFAVHTDRVISVNRRDVPPVSKSLVEEVLTTLGGVARRSSWLKM